MTNMSYCNTRDDLHVCLESMRRDNMMSHDEALAGQAMFKDFLTFCHDYNIIAESDPEMVEAVFEDLTEKTADAQRTWVNGVQELIVVAKKQGVALDAKEADMILGYLEGHDYRLMADDKGVTFRHDNQDGDDHRGDDPYTIQDVIAFCQEMNEELLNDDCSQDEDYLSQLREDEQVLETLMEQSAGRTVSEAVLHPRNVLGHGWPYRLPAAGGRLTYNARAKRHSYIVSLEDLDSHGMHDTIPDPRQNIERLVESKALLEQAVSVATPKEASILRLLINGFALHEAAQFLKMPKAAAMACVENFCCRARAVL